MCVVLKVNRHIEIENARELEIHPARLTVS